MEIATAASSLKTAALTPVINGQSLDQHSDIPPLNPQLVECYRNLDRAIRQLSTVHSYTARWVRQIRLYGSVRDEEHVDLKVRHEPFSVHLNWLDGSQQALYSEGLYDGKLIAHKSRGFASLRPVWRLLPESRIAMKDSRYPITQIGMLRLAERLKQVVSDIPLEAKLDVSVTRSEFQNRPAIRQYVNFGSPAVQSDYSESELFIDEETMGLVSITNHGWTNGGEGSEFIEHYRYEQINWDARLTDEDFDEKNEAYPFAR
ncbi:MAG: DUF1571 domain-containing protein [Planctomycetaceae bacterium]|nr:DUF1571 domain-containing protein [Planctomycetaceae bacterium]